MEETKVETPNNGSVKWRWWAGVTLVVSIFYISQITTAIMFVLYGALRGMSYEQTQAWLEKGSTYPQFFFMLVTELIVIGSILGFARFYKGGLRSIGIRKPSDEDVYWALIFIPVYFVAFFATVGLATRLFPSLDVNQAQEIGFDGVRGGLEMVATFVSLVILPPIAEEIMVRGMLYSSLKKVLPVFWSTVFASLLFAAPHLLEGGDGKLLYIAGIDTFVLSLFLIYLREKTDGLWSPMILHAFKNGIAFLALFVFKVH